MDPISKATAQNMMIKHIPNNILIIVIDHNSFADSNMFYTQEVKLEESGDSNITTATSIYYDLPANDTCALGLIPYFE
jgi:hypothetical protein